MELWLAVDNTYHRAMSIPLDTYPRFSIFPLTWLAYLGFAICGREGYISNSPAGPAIDHRPDETQPGIYYYIAGSELYFEIQGLPSQSCQTHFGLTLL